jgi:hypothetical protein
VRTKLDELIRSSDAGDEFIGIEAQGGVSRPDLSNHEVETVEALALHLIGFPLPAAVHTAISTPAISCGRSSRRLGAGLAATAQSPSQQRQARLRAYAGPARRP